MEGWWCVRHGDALAWVEAPSAPAVLRRSLDLHALGDWTDDAGALVVFPQDAYPENAGPHDYTRAVLRAEPSPARRRRRGSGSRFALACEHVTVNDGGQAIVGAVESGGGGRG